MNHDKKIRVSRCGTSTKFANLTVQGKVVKPTHTKWCISFPMRIKCKEEKQQIQITHVDL